MIINNKQLLTYENQKGLYQSKVTTSLASTQRQGHQALSSKMDYFELARSCITNLLIIIFLKNVLKM